MPGADMRTCFKPIPDEEGTETPTRALDTALATELQTDPR